VRRRRETGIEAIKVNGHKSEGEGEKEWR